MLRIYYQVKEIVKGYDIYIRNKSLRYIPYGMLKPSNIPSKPWISIVWDFVGELLESVELVMGICYNIIFVITDRFTKYAYILLYKIIYMAINIVYIFL
jgi:hypothetical protein